MSDPRNEARHVKAVIRRAMRSRTFNVMPANYRERRALRRMEVRGQAASVVGFPDVWTLHPHKVRCPL